ncbi:MAG: gamma-glutamyltransferase family protein [Burkholderiales bacterium]|nr:gamma-glutamyltransferase family protein [Burkholderiales bacterium]
MAVYRPCLTGRRHMVSAGHYSAAHAAFQILEAGGNAIDAGVAAGIALGVLQTDRVNFAGVAPIMIWLAGERRVVNIDGLGTWPLAASIDAFRRDHGGAMPPGILRTVMPAAPAAWLKALAEHGTMSFGEVAQSAIRLAREGFAMHGFMADYIREHEAVYRRWPASAAVFLPGGRPPRAGENFVQRDLAASLQYMADEETAHRGKGRSAGLRAARDAFYRGDIARKIAHYHRENGGWVTLADLAEFDVRVEPTVRTLVRGLEVHACGPWSQGPVLPQALNILAGFDLKAMGHNSVAYVHHVVEALKLAFADRHRYYGDPRFVDVPLEVLLSSGYAASRGKLVRAGEAWAEMPPAGDVSGHARATPPPAAARGEPAPLADTSYACVVDADGNGFSTTPSDGSSATPVIPGTGLCPSSRGTQSWTDPAHPAALAPGKRPRLTPNPALVLKDGRLYMPFGSPGNDIQPQAMLQVFLNVALWDMDPQAAVEAPRFATYSFPSSSEPHAYHPGRLNLESRFERAVVDGLAALGHKVAPWREIEWRAGAVCAIRVNAETGFLEGGADPRRPCYALGV